MIVIPNLFGAYQKGREEAIKANWEDLSNYEDIESKRTQNDLNALTLLGRQADFGYDRENARFVYNRNQRDDEVGNLRHTGDLARTASDNLLASAGYQVLNDRNSLGQLYGIADTNFGTHYNTAQAGNADSSTNLMRANVKQQALSANYQYALETAIKLEEKRIGRALTSAEIENIRTKVTLAYNLGYGSDLSLHHAAGEADAKAQATNANTAVTTASTADKAAQYTYETQVRDQQSALNNRIAAVINNMETARVQNNPEAFALYVREYEQLTNTPYDGRPFSSPVTMLPTTTPAGTPVGSNTVLLPTNAQGGGSNTSAATPTTTTPAVPVVTANIFSVDPSGRGVGNPTYATNNVDGVPLYNRPPYTRLGSASLFNRSALIGWGTPGYEYPRW